MATLAPHDVPAETDGWLRLVSKDYPGGKWILPHLQDGPYWLVVVRTADRTNWQVRDCLAAHPGFLVPYADPHTGELGKATVHPVADFARHLLSFHASDDDDVLEDLTAGPFETPTGLDQVVPMLPALLGHADDTSVTMVLTDAAERHGAANVLRFVSALDQEVTDDADSLEAAVAGTFAAAPAR